MVWVVFSSWFGNRAGGCDQAREGNTDRSMHWHFIVPDPPTGSRSAGAQPVFSANQRSGSFQIGVALFLRCTDAHSRVVVIKRLVSFL